MKEDDHLSRLINTYPRESLWLCAFFIMFIWQTLAAVSALIVYVLINQVFKINKVIVLLLGVSSFIVTVYFLNGNLSIDSIESYFYQGFKTNKLVWYYLFNNQYDLVILFLQDSFFYAVETVLLLVSILFLVDLIPKNPHEAAMYALKKAEYDKQKELSEKEISKAFKKLSDKDESGTVLGISKLNGEAVIVPDTFINQIALVLGTTGSGKTITLRRFYQRAIIKDYPLIIIDGKPDADNINWLMNLTKEYQRNFIGFNCANMRSYDALANGSFTELKDKIICLKDQWENDYYRSIAEDYLQTTFEVLLKLESKPNLKQVVNCLSYSKLKLLASKTADESLIDRVVELKNYERKDITGLQAHLNILINSELGRFFDQSDHSFSLNDVIDDRAIVYFALPALRFPSFAKVLGKLVINDIKAMLDRNQNRTPIFTIFDEFSVFAGEQVLNLVNMGRGKGVHAIFGTQGLADLDRVDLSFKKQVLNCVNTLICHRLNDQDSAESIANWIGTKDAFTVTAQLNMQETQGGMGSVRVNKEYIVHPDAIKQGLNVGEAFLVSKVGGFGVEKVRVRNDII